jgi:hypothetical protein
MDRPTVPTVPKIHFGKERPKTMSVNDVNGGAKWDHRGGVKRDHLAAAGLSL